MDILREMVDARAWELETKVRGYCQLNGIPFETADQMIAFAISASDLGDLPDRVVDALLDALRDRVRKHGGYSHAVKVANGGAFPTPADLTDSEFTKMLWYIGQGIRFVITNHGRVEPLPE